MEFKERIRQLRIERNLSAAQLAALFDKSEGAVRMWETGRSKPDADTLVKIAVYFNVPIDYILGLKDNRYPEYTLVSSELGLSEKAILELRTLSKFRAITNDDRYYSADNRTCLDVTNQLIESDLFFEFIHWFSLLSYPSPYQEESSDEPMSGIKNPSEFEILFRKRMSTVFESELLACVKKMADAIKQQIMLSKED